MWSGAEIKVRLRLLRHGKTLSNIQHRYLGRTDEALCAEGERELLELMMFCPESEYLFTGPMLRCRQTAKLLFPDKEQIIIPEWMEIDFGEFEGKTYKELEGNRAYKEWIDSNGTIPFPGGDDREKFIKRSVKGLKRMAEILKNKQDYTEQECIDVCAVVHGGTIMAILNVLDGGEYFNYQVKNGESYYCTILCSEEKIKLLELEKR